MGKGCRRFFIVTATIAITFAPKGHYDDAHEGAEKNRQKGQNRVYVDLSSCHEKSNQTGNGEENKKCFS